jgi:hypothetical protein
MLIARQIHPVSDILFDAVIRPPTFDALGDTVGAALPDRDRRALADLL